MRHTNGTDPYRVQDTRTYRRTLTRWVERMKATNGNTKWAGAVPALRALRYVTWKRTWQAEWPGCQKAARAYTRRGVLRRASRWQRKTPTHTQAP